MAKKRQIDTVFWDDNYIANLDPIEKLLYLYLITNNSTNIIGVYQIQLKRMASDTGIDKEMCEKIINRFQNEEKVFYENGWIVIRNFIKHQNYNSPQVKVGMERELNSIPSYLIPYIYSIDTILNKDISISSSSSIDTKKEKKEKKEIYAERVTLTLTEYNKLIEKFGEIVTKDKIEALSLYKCSKGKKYSSDYHTILAWDRKDKKTNVNQSQYKDL